MKEVDLCFRSRNPGLRFLLKRMQDIYDIVKAPGIDGAPSVAIERGDNLHHRVTTKALQRFGQFYLRKNQFRFEILCGICLIKCLGRPKVRRVNRQTNSRQTAGIMFDYKRLPRYQFGNTFKPP